MTESNQLPSHKNTNSSSSIWETFKDTPTGLTSSNNPLPLRHRPSQRLGFSSPSAPPGPPAMVLIHPKLPHLLSSLPANGHHALVRPHCFPPTSFYLITRTRLRFRPTELPAATPPPVASEKPVTVVGAGTKAGVGAGTSAGRERLKREVKAVDVMQAGGLKAHGRAYGMLFWNGECECERGALRGSRAPRHR